MGVGIDRPSTQDLEELRKRTMSRLDEYSDDEEDRSYEDAEERNSTRT